MLSFYKKAKYNQIKILENQIKIPSLFKTLYSWIIVYILALNFNGYYQYWNIIKINLKYSWI